MPKDAPLIRGADPFLEAQIAVYRARLEELYASYNAEPIHERVKRKILLEDIERLQGDLHQAEEKLEKLLVRSPSQGKFVLIDPLNLPGRFVKQGTVLGYIVTDQRPIIRAVVSQTDIGLVRERISQVEVRLAERLALPFQADIVRLVPAAELNLPSSALGTGGGGVIPIDPSDPERVRALESHFQVDLGLPEEVKDPHIGGRAYVRFEHGRMPLAMQWYRGLRQLLMRGFYV
jgi:putative peptide zinc metalloprotease protein